MTKDEMQRLLDRQFRDGATELEALRYLAEIIGLTLRPAVPERREEKQD